MLTNYIKLAWRNLYLHKGFTAIHLIGLATGISFSFIIGAYVWSEFRVNRDLKNADAQYVIQSKWKENNQGIELTTLGPLAKALKDNYPGLVKNYYRWDGITSNVSRGDKVFREGIQIGDSTMLNMYGFSLKHGNPQTALNGTYNVVVTEKNAVKYFGRTDVVGETLTIENFSGSRKDFIITGVLEPLSKNSITYINPDNENQLFLSIENLSFFGRNMDWDNRFILNYIELQPGITPEQLKEPIRHLLKTNVLPSIAENLSPFIVPLKEYHMKANNGLVNKMIVALSGIAFFILLMAVVNFINISVSRATSRMREIGVRKVMGGLKKQLILQFLSESILMVFISALLSLVIYSLSSGFFTSLLGINIPAITDFPIHYSVYLLLFILLLGTLAGVYPAFFLSSLKSVESLKGKQTSVKEKIWLRKGLVTFQFVTAIIVFAGAMVITRQVNLFFKKDLGYEKDYIVSAQVPRDWTPAGTQKLEVIRNEFERLPEVEKATLSYEIPDGRNAGPIAMYTAGSDSSSAVRAQMLMTDQHYAETYQIPLIAGAYFTENGSLTDSSKIVINESQAKAFGWTPQEAIGKQLQSVGSMGFVYTISGVIKDFHFESMQRAIQPVSILPVNLTNTYRFLSFRLKPGSLSHSVTALTKKWNELMPGKPFEYSFMEDKLKMLYLSEMQLKKASYTAAVLSLIIVLLGVVGLVILSLHKRTKEVGIRKVLGASINGIIAMFMRDFLVIILIAGLIACPIAWIIMQHWLNDYVYKIDLSVLPFAGSVLLLGAITMLMIAWQTLKTAMEKPVKSLRTE